MLHADDSRSLSLLYHLNSEPWANSEACSTEYEVSYKESGGDEIALPSADNASGLLSLLRLRRSCRDFARQEMKLSELATILRGAYGIVGKGHAYRRAVPSAGGLYPLELYLVTRDLRGLNDSIYHYNVRGHTLEPWRHAPSSGELARCFLSQNYIEQAGAVVLISAVFARTQQKYGPRGYRYALLEAGHVAQNLCLLAAERELGSLCAGGFVDTMLNRLLMLDGINEAIVYAVAIGNFKDSDATGL